MRFQAPARRAMAYRRILFGAGWRSTSSQLPFRCEYLSSLGGGLATPAHMNRVIARRSCRSAAAVDARAVERRQLSTGEQPAKPSWGARSLSPHGLPDDERPVKVA